MTRAQTCCHGACEQGRKCHLRESHPSARVGTVAGMIVAIILFAVIGLMQTLDDSDAQKLRQQIEARK